MSNQTIDFKSLIARMEEAQESGQERPTILGGQFSSDRLDEFLKAWSEQWEKMPVRIWEHVSQIGFGEKPAEPEYLQRAEIFGEGGHLSLRRDGSVWLWHYIGPAGASSPAGFSASSFWDETGSKDLRLRRYEEEVLLWGEAPEKKPTGKWWEDRVAAADLEYPGQLLGARRVCLKFWRYTQGGRTEFVWYRELAPCKG